MGKPVFYKPILHKVEGNVLEDVFPHLVGTKHMPTMEERLGDGECPECPKETWVEKTHTRWMLLAEESASVTQGGKAYIECLDCGYTTHL
jgi:hypothetical protein